MSKIKSGSWVTRKYKTEKQARQAWDDLRKNGANCCYSESGGDADGTGGEYEVSFNKDSYKENKKMKEM
jgi:hypothetical protein